MKAVVCLIAAVLAGISWGQSVFGNASKAFALMPSEVISSGVVSQVSISNSGRLILFQRQIISEVEEKPQNTKSWYLFDRTTKSTKRLTIPSTSMVTGMFDDVHLVHNSNSPDVRAGILNFKTGENLPVELKSGYLMYGGNLPFAPFLMINDGMDNITFLTAEGKSTVATFAKILVFPVQLAATLKTSISIR